MIRIEIVGAGGWLSVLLWSGMVVGVPVFCYRIGKTIGRDGERDRWEAEEHEAWMARNGAVQAAHEEDQ